MSQYKTHETKQRTFVVLLKTVRCIVSLKITTSILFGRVLTKVSFVQFVLMYLRRIGSLWSLAICLNTTQQRLTWWQTIQSFIQAPSTRIRVQYESATIYFRIQKFLRPHVSILKSSLPGLTVVPRAPLGILVTEHAS